MYYPSEQEFIELSRKGNLIPVYKEIAAEGETPISAYKKIEDEYSFLLESIEGGKKIAQYSFLGSSSVKNIYYPKSFEDLRKLQKRYKPVRIPGVPRFHGGLVGYISYDLVREIEPRLIGADKNPDDLKLPGMIFLLTDTILVFDHIQRKTLIISNAHIRKDPVKAYQRACAEIDKLEKKLRIKAPIQLGQPRKKQKLKITSSMTKKQFEKAVLRAKEYIKAGDIIQVVLSQRFETKSGADPFEVYSILRKINPSPYMYYLKLGKLNIIGSSPEVMVRLENRIATLRPIAGTRPRGKDKKEDKKLEQELLASEKEKAEHIMLVDLGRNDLGRVCEFGSVRVTEKMVIEKYSHVMHIVSNIAGKIKPGKDAIDLLRASFPAGTVSGAPKVRAMEIIDELENLKRGPYAGCVGYLSFSGNLDTAITIRTIIIKDSQAYVQAGAGIVADSVPSREYQETVNKAKGMLKAIELAQ